MEMTLIVVAFLMGANDGHSQIQTQSKSSSQKAKPQQLVVWGGDHPEKITNDQRISQTQLGPRVNKFFCAPSLKDKTEIFKSRVVLVYKKKGWV